MMSNDELIGRVRVGFILKKEPRSRLFLLTKLSNYETI